MALVYNGTTYEWEDPVYFNDTLIRTIYFNDTKVYGVNTTWSQIFSFGLAPDSANFENSIVPALQTTYADAFTSQAYTQGPGTDTVYRVVLAYGYRLRTSDGTWYEGESVNLYEGHSVTGANTSHNGGTSCYIDKLGNI